MPQSAKQYWLTFTESGWANFEEGNWLAFEEAVPPVLSPADVSLVLSGGSFNAKTTQSLGGDPSYQVVVGLSNNLFDDVTSDQGRNGLIDHRCIYLLNASDQGSLYQAKLFVDEPGPAAGTLSLGFMFATETQRIVVSGVITGGSLGISLTTVSGTTSAQATHSPTPSQWADNVRAAVEAVCGFDGVSVSASQMDTTIVFTVSFTGEADSRYFPTLGVSDDDLTGSSITSSAAKVESGGPINQTAPQIGSGTAQPPNVEFFEATLGDPVFVGTVGPGDFLPIWFRRDIPAGTGSFPSDGFSLRVSGNPVSDTATDILE